MKSHALLRTIIDLVVVRLNKAAAFLFQLRPPREHRAAFAIQGEPARSPGDPNQRDPPMKPTSYITKGGIRVTREIRNHDYQPAGTALAQSLDERRGVLFSSSFEFPGRYTRWDMGFVDPPLVFTARGRGFSIDALNERGCVLLDPIGGGLGG